MWAKPYVISKKRLYEHLDNIRSKNVKDPIGRHFNSSGHTGKDDQVKTFILAFVTKPKHSEEAKNMRLRFERSWIHKLRTPLPHGLNSMD